MKKLTCILLLLTFVFALTACNPVEKVAIYVPDTVTEYEGNSETPVSVTHLLYSKGWEKSESFTVSHSADGKVPTEGGATITYADKHTTTNENETRVDEYLDEKGQVVSRNVLYERSSQLIQTVFSYDAYGRILTQITSTSFVGGNETYLPQVTYTYEETDQGSKAVGEQNGYEETYCYDKNYNLISYTASIMGTETGHTEYAYDEHGNNTEISVYADGQLATKSVITYKIVEVYKTTADLLPQFKKAQ